MLHSILYGFIFKTKGKEKSAIGENENGKNPNKLRGKISDSPVIN